MISAPTSHCSSPVRIPWHSVVVFQWNIHSKSTSSLTGKACTTSLTRIVPDSLILLSSVMRSTLGAPIIIVLDFHPHLHRAKQDQIPSQHRLRLVWSRVPPPTPSRASAIRSAGRIHRSPVEECLRLKKTYLELTLGQTRRSFVSS